MGKCFRLRLPAVIKVQTNKNYETCDQRYKLCNINQTCQSATWKENRIEFKKYAEGRFWANMCKIVWDFRSVRIISLSEKKVVETISKAIKDSSDVLCFGLYVINVFEKSTKAERCTDVIFKLTLYCLCYCWKSKFITKIYVWRHTYFRYELFRSRLYFSCTVGARHEGAPNFSCLIKFISKF